VRQLVNFIAERATKGIIEARKNRKRFESTRKVEKKLQMVIQGQ
jgi:hypothetical protein